MNIGILYEDEHLLVINKPAGLLVHPIPGGQGTTLIDWLRDQYPGFEHQEWADSNRPGIVHRLDRDTSGVMIIAKNPAILADLQKQFADREVSKVYLALVVGTPDWQEQTVKASVDRANGTKRKASFLKLGDTAKEAETHFTMKHEYRILNSRSQAFDNLSSGRTQDSRFKIQDSSISLIEARPKTGRTHQIRVHLGLLEHPILGDPWYQTKTSRNLAKALNVPRLLLHAQTLTLRHPVTNEELSATTPLPEDFQQVLGQIIDISAPTD